MKRALRLPLVLTLSLVCCIESAAVIHANETIDIINNVGTTQAFAEGQIPEEDIQTILEAGCSAESAINQQPWFFVALTDQELMKEIAASGGGFGGPRPDKMPEGMEKPEGTEAPEGAEMPEGMEAPEGAEMPAPPEAGGEDGAAAPAAPAAKASLGDSPLAILLYKDPNTASPDPDFDCGLAAQNMYLAAASLGYGVKIVSSPTMALNGEKHDEICEKLGIDTSLEAVAVLLIGNTEEADTVTSASIRETPETKAVIL